MLALLVPVNADWYALDIRSVREVVARPVVTAVPTGPASLLGLFNLRGEIVPLFDLAALLGRGRTGAGPFATIVRTTVGLAGLSVSGMAESVELGEPEPVDGVVGSGVGVGVATYALGARLATLLDVEQILGGGPVGGSDG